MIPDEESEGLSQADKDEDSVRVVYHPSLESGEVDSLSLQGACGFVAVCRIA